MMKTIVLFLFLLFTFLPLNAKLIRVLAIGNSFSEDAVEQYLYELAADQGDSLVIGNAYIGGCSIDTHFDNLKTDKAAYRFRKVIGGVRSEQRQVTLRMIIQDEQWDIISLQQASQLSGVFTSFSNLAQFKRLIQSYTTNLHVKFVWHMTWAYAEGFTSDRFEYYGFSQRRMYDAITAVVQQVMPAVGIKKIIPSGTAIQLARISLGDSLTRDGYHLNYTIGRYTAACTWCEFLTGRNVKKNKFWPETLSAEEAKICRQAAHEACEMQEKKRYVIL